MDFRDGLTRFNSAVRALPRNSAHDRRERTSVPSQSVPQIFDPAITSKNETPMPRARGARAGANVILDVRQKRLWRDPTNGPIPHRLAHERRSIRDGKSVRAMVGVLNAFGPISSVASENVLVIAGRRGRNRT
jgi:hypothetical protein